MRRATVSTGSNSDLQELQKVRAAHRRRSDNGTTSGGGIKNYNSNANRGMVGGAMTKAPIRRSVDDLTEHKKSEAGRKQFAFHGNRRNLLSRSMSASDEIRREAQAMVEEDEKKEQSGGGVKIYDPISHKKRVSSNPYLSSAALESPPPSLNEEELPSNRNDSWSLSQDPRASNSSPLSLCGIPGIRLEDLVPTRNVSASPDNISTENRALDNSGNSRGRGGGEEGGVIDQWRSKTLMMFPPQIDFELGNSATSGGRSTPPPQSVGVHEKLHAKEAVESPSTDEYEYTDDKDCPRKKFASLYSAGGSKSGGTGNTSRGSMFSSRGSLDNEGNANPTMVPSIAAIEEEDKPRAPNNNNNKRGEGDEHSLQSTSSKFSLKSLRSRASRRTRRLAHIRKSIRHSLTGKSDGIPLVICDDGKNSDAVSDHSEHVDPEKIRRHFLERKASSSSITSAYSNITATDTISKDERTPPGWRFRLRKGGFVNQSMSALSLERDRGRRRNSWVDDDESSSGAVSFTDFYDNELHSGMMRSIITKSTSVKSLGLSLPTVDEGENSERQLNKVEEKNVEVTLDNLANVIPNSKLDTSEKSDDTAESFYRHPAHEHPLLHVRPNQLFPQSPGWRCDLCMTDTLDLNEWAYVSTGLNYLVCERCFCQNGVALAK